MVDRIWALKNELIGQAEKDMRDKGAARMDGDLVDMIHDLAKAEEACWEAEYYRSVVEAMENRQGYMPEMRQDSMRQGYQSASQYGGKRRGYGMRMGYSDPIESLKAAMESATPEERERMKQEVRQITGM